MRGPGLLALGGLIMTLGSFGCVLAGPPVEPRPDSANGPAVSDAEAVPRGADAERDRHVRATGDSGPLGEPVESAAGVPAGSGAAADGTTIAPEPALETYTGSASYYADKFEGRTTASGIPFRQSRMWAAHKTLPFGTRVRVTNVANGKQVEVVVVDRGPFIRGRIIDLSKAAARELDFIRAGHTPVTVEVLEWGDG